MIIMPGGGRLVQSIQDLPNLSACQELFLDVETNGLYSFGGDRICGVAVTVDDNPFAWYVPVRHTSLFGNLPIDGYRRWLKDTMNGCRDWINHNILFDSAHVLFDEVVPQCRLIDTLTLSKMHHSDLFDYGLKTLCRDWLGMPMAERIELDAYLKSIKSKNFADAPVELLGRYACMDVMGNRALYRFLCRERPEDMLPLWETEIALTPVLADMERIGLQVDRQECKMEQLKSMSRMIDAAGELYEMTGKEFTNSNACMFDLLINQCGLPVLMTKEDKDEEGRRYDTGRPTFDKKAMKLYKIHPTVLSNPKTKRILELVTTYRKEQQHLSLFVEPFLELMDCHQVIHPTYNQLVRTGRMSCSRPNSQQQNSRSKALIHPREGYGFISLDYSQIEFRLIVHYIGDAAAIKSYNENPDTDFHQWVADLIGVKRRPAKTLNFGMGFGAGKKRVANELAGDEDIIAHISEAMVSEIEQGLIAKELQTAIFKQRCFNHASMVYDTYHEKLPSLKPTAKQAEHAARVNGYVRNLYKRRRHLDRKVCHKAFNTAVQGSAMDLIKERMVEVAPRYNPFLRDRNISMLANVHDALLFEVPLELMTDPEVQNHLINVLESPRVPLSIPIRVGMGISQVNWAIADGDESVEKDGVIVAGCVR